MAYGLAYFGEFYDLDGLGHRVEIRNINKLDDTGAIRMTITERPVVSELPSQDRFDVIFSKGLTLRVSNTKAEGQLFYAPLFGVPETDNRVDYYFDPSPGVFETGLLQFRGYVIPALYTDILGALPNAIEINANDRISSLKNELYPGPPDDEGFLFPVIKYLDDMLKLTGVSLPIVVQCQLFAENHLQATTETFIDQTYLDKEIFLKSNGDINDAYTMVREILKPMMLRIYQDISPDNKELSWIIERIPEMNTTPLYYTRYTDGVKTNSFTWAPEIHDLITEDKMLDGENTLSYQSGYKTVELTFDLLKYSNLLLIATLLKAQDSNITTGLDPVFGAPAPIKEWKKHETVTLYDPVNSRNLFQIQPFGTYEANNPPATSDELDGLWTETNFSFLTPGDTLSITVEAEYSINSFDTFVKGQNQHCILEVWLFENPSIPGLASSPEGYIIETISAGEPLGDWRFVLNPSGVPLDPLDPVSVADAYARMIRTHVFAADNTDYNVAANRTHEFVFEIPLQVLMANAFGDYTLMVKLVPFHYGDDLDNNDLAAALVLPTRVGVNKFELTVDNIEVDNVYEGTLNTDFTERYTDNYKVAELPTLNYKNSFLYSDYKRTKGWSLFGSIDPYINIMQEYFDWLFNTFQIPRFSIVGSVRGQARPFRVLYNEPEVTGKLYYQVGLKHSLYRAISELTLAEYAPDLPATIEKDYTIIVNADGVEFGDTTISPDGLTLTVTLNYGTCVSSPSHYLNKWYYEVLITSGPTPGVGISSPSKITPGADVAPGDDPFSVALDGSTGKVWQNAQEQIDYLVDGQFGPGDIVGVAVDFSNYEIQFFINGVSAGAPVGFFSTADNRWGPGFGSRGQGDGLVATMNTGQTAFSFPQNIPAKWNDGWFSTIYDFDPTDDGDL
jgi:hypothetical protein